MYNRLNHKISVCHLTSKAEIKHKSFQGVGLRIHENDRINTDPQDPASSRRPGSRTWHTLATCLRAASRVYWTTFITWGTNLRSLGSSGTFLDVFYWKEKKWMPNPGNLNYQRKGLLEATSTPGPENSRMFPGMKTSSSIASEHSWLSAGLERYLHSLSEPRGVLWSVTKGPRKAMSGTGKAPICFGWFLTLWKRVNSPNAGTGPHALPTTPSPPPVKRATSERNVSCLFNQWLGFVIYLAKWANLGSAFCSIHYIRTITQLPSPPVCRGGRVEPGPHRIKLKLGIRKKKCPD